MDEWTEENFKNALLDASKLLEKEKWKFYQERGSATWSPEKSGHFTALESMQKDFLNALLGFFESVYIGTDAEALKKIIREIMDKWKHIRNVYNIGKGGTWAKGHVSAIDWTIKNLDWLSRV